MIPTAQAAWGGACAGLLAGFAISVLLGLDLREAAYRTSILTIGGAWLGVLLAWFSQIVMSLRDRQDDARGDPPA